MKAMLLHINTYDFVGLKLASILTDERDEALNSLLLGDILLYALLGLVERYLAATCTHIAIVGISHLTRAVHNTTHDTNLQAHHILGGSLDLGDSLLQVVECATATRALDILGLGKLDAGGLKDGIGQLH